MLSRRKGVSRKDMPVKDRYLGVILEDVNKKFDLIIEGQQVTQKQIDFLEKRFEDFQKETRDNFTAVFKYLSHLDETIRPLQREMQKLKEEEWEKRLNRLEEILLKRE